MIVLVRLLEPPPAAGRAADPPPPAEGGYLLTSWNVENLYDDTDDPKDHDERRGLVRRRPGRRPARS